MADPIPFIRFIKIIHRNGGLSAKGWPHCLPWITKTVLLEPVRWIECVRYKKQIERHQIREAPVFILGHYRSGTTFLQRMFMQDDRLGAVTIFQTVLPEIMLTAEEALTPFFDRASRLLGIKNPFHRIPMQWKNFPGEEDVGMTALLQYTGSQWGQLFPKKLDQYLNDFVLMQNQQLETAWKNDYLWFLKKVSLRNQAKPLVLKNPPNTARIKTLLEIFPDAKFIHICRNPVEVFYSTKRLWQVILQNYSLGNAGPLTVEELIFRSYPRIMDKFLEQKHLIPQDKLVEISYEDFVHEPVEQMRMIYHRLQLPEFAYCEASMKQFASEQKNYQVLNHRGDAETVSRIGTEWARHIQYWQTLSER